MILEAQRTLQVEIARTDEGIGQRCAGIEGAALAVQRAQRRARFGGGVADGREQPQAVAAQRLVEGGAAIGQVGAAVGRDHAVQAQASAGAEGVVEEDGGLGFVTAEIARAMIVGADEALDRLGIDHQRQVGGAGRGLRGGQHIADIQAWQVAGQQQLALQNLRRQRARSGDALSVGFEKGTGAAGVPLYLGLADAAFDDADMQRAVGDVLRRHHRAAQHIAGVAVGGGDLGGQFVGVGQADGAAGIGRGQSLQRRVRESGIALERHRAHREGHALRGRTGRGRALGRNVDGRAHRGRGRALLEAFIDAAGLRRSRRRRGGLCQDGGGRRQQQCARKGAQPQGSQHFKPQPDVPRNGAQPPKILRLNKPILALRQCTNKGRVPFCINSQEVVTYATSE